MCIKIIYFPVYDVLNFEIDVTGCGQIVFVMLSGVLVAKVSNISLTLSDLHTMVFNYGVLKICANKLLVHAKFNILTIPFTITQHKS